MIHCNLHFQCVFHQKDQKTVNLSTLLLGLAPGKFQYFGIIKLQTKRYKNSGIFHSRKKNIKPKNIHGFIHFLQLSISMGHNCPVFIRLFVARMYDSYAKGLADRPTVYESKVSRMK